MEIPMLGTFRTAPGQRSLRMAKYILRVALMTALMTGTILAASAKSQEKTLLVWAGDQARVAPDFIAVVDFDPKSATYGRVLRTVPLSGASAVGNEPHHANLSRDGRTLALGGLLSILKGQEQVFFFDVTNPRNPTFISSDKPTDASITDDFAALNNGGFLVSYMGGGN